MRVCWRWLGCASFLVLMGCGGKSGSPVAPPSGSAVASRVEGYLANAGARQAGLVLTATPPASGQVSGASVDIVNRLGTTVAHTETGNDGGFALVDIPLAGTVQLSVTPAGGATTQFWVTLVHARTVLAGQTFATDRAAAVSALNALAPADALVALGQNPLPDNTEVHPTFGDENSAMVDDTTAHLTSGDEWFGLIDPTPGAPFSHNVRYVFINAGTGAVTTVDNQPWLPSVNFVPTWDYERDLLRYVGPLPTAHAMLTEPAPMAANAVSASPDVVSFPPLPAPRSSAMAAAPARQNGNPDFFGLIWIGVPEVWFMVDEDRVHTWMRAMGIPDSQIFAKTGVTYEAPSDPMIPPLRSGNALGLGGGIRGRAAAHGFDVVEAAIRKRRQDGGFPTLYVWAESHGDRVGRVRDLDLDEGIGSTAYNFALKIGSFFSSELKKITPPEVTALPLKYIDDVLPIHTTTACDVRAWAATCFSYNHLARWRANFLPTQHDVILYSSAGDVPSFGFGFVSQCRNFFTGDETHFSELGLNFTRQVTSFQPPAFTPYAAPPASTGPQTWARPSQCRALGGNRAPR